MKTPSSNATGPLRGLRVIDFSHFVAGPFATQLLADLGAEVIKIENPTRGDEFRHHPPAIDKLAGEGPSFLWTNRNKKSIAINMKKPESRKVIQDLLEDADILVENFSTGVMERFGLGYDQLAVSHPTLIYCSVSAYSRCGPLADRNGFDPIAQAESGFMSLNGYPDREGVKTSSAVMDIAASMQAASGILAAVVERLRSGRGQRVEISLYASAIMMLGYAAQQVLSDSGWTVGRNGNNSADTAPTGVFYAQDGPIYISCTTTEIYQRLFTLIGREDMANDPELVVKVGRLRHRERLFATVNAALATDTREHWLSRLHAVRVPAGPVRTIEEALSSSETKALGIVSQIPHPGGGTVANIRSPISLSATPLAAPVAAPALGEHTRQILAESLGYSDERIVELNSAGVFGERLRFYPSRSG